MANINNNQFIIAIGASAGGLQAISALFDYTPLDAVSYIIIQHLSADFKSQMTEILSRHSKLEVIEATDKVKIQGNTVYLIPSSKFMTIKSGRLLLTDKKDHKGPHMTIDHFFTSLAQERGSKAIGIVLSGTGTDGSKGVTAIKSSGGRILVQDPVTASFSAMPLAAIATGCADSILSPQAMPQVIEDYVKDGLLELLTDQKEDEISEIELERIINLIKGNLPLDFTDYKRPTIIRRIKRRMVQHNFSRVDKYYKFLLANPKEIEALSNDFLIGVTSFFRDPEAFKIIEEKVIPGIVGEKDDGDVLKIWVAGCASGEEAYSLAILVKEYLMKTRKTLEVRIFATDINKASLDKASKGLFSDTVEKTVSKERLQNFFTRENARYKIKQEIRKMLIFAQHDLVKNPPYCNIDLISCRNLLIYMSPVLQKKVFSMVHFGLKKDGFLFLGPSESAAPLKSDFIELSNKWNILRSAKNGHSVRFNTFSAPVIEGMKTTNIEFDQKAETPKNKLGMAEEINLAILEESGLSGICTDEKLTVIRAFGNISEYLKNEIFNFDLKDLLPDNISIAFKAAAHKAIKLGEKVVLDNMKFDRGEASVSLVKVVFKPISSTKSAEKLLLILFIDKKDRISKENVITAQEIEQLAREHVHTLERELSEVNQKLESAYERIEASNENMQSFNEELLSANEEMQSANEELQSVNEELQTINKEQQLTNVELTELNDDLNNYFRSNVNGQLFVDREMLLKKYSPGAVKHINIRESDIGRPLSNITTNIKLETLTDDIAKVLTTNDTIIREAESSDGKIYQVMTMPYVRKESGKSDGAIISFYDITELKQLLTELDISNKSLLRINNDLNNFVYSVSHDLNAPMSNIKSILALLREKVDMSNPEVLKLSALINKALKNHEDVIADMIKVGRLDSEMLSDGDVESFEDLCNDIMEILSERIVFSKASITLDLQEKNVRFPKKNLRSIILNLLTNALKFASADRHPEITIKTSKADGFILLSVKDNGIGISKDRTDFIFEMYHRINHNIEGQGIGLFLIKKIVDASGGKIEVESSSGSGSTFNIFFKS